MVFPRSVVLRVGDSETPRDCVDVKPFGYLPSPDSIVEFVRVVLQTHPEAQTFSTVNGSVCLAFFLLHKRREIDCTNVFHVPTQRMIQIDYRGEFIQPWPDELFEIDFFLRFPNAKE